MKTGLLAVM